MSRLLIIVRNADDRDFDRYILAPAGMEIFVALERVDEIVAARQEQGEGWDEIEAQLESQGFETLNWAHAEMEI